MKKFKLCIIILMMIIVTGCNTTKENIDVVSFQNTLEENNFKVYDITDEYGYATRAIYASKGSATINYVEGKKKYDIQGIFLDECKNVYNTASADYKDKTDGGKNWTYLTVTDDDNYYFVGWVENSYITIKAPKDQETKMNNLAKELGYR